jgi:hypothetical protein
MQLLLVFFLKNKTRYLIFLFYLKISKRRVVKNLWINLGGYFFIFWGLQLEYLIWRDEFFLRHHTRKKTKPRRLTLVVALKSVCSENQIS